MKTFVKICWVSTCLPSPRNWCSFRDDCISRSRCARLPWFQASFQSTSAHSCSAVSATLDLVHLQECQTCVFSLSACATSASKESTRLQTEWGKDAVSQPRPPFIPTLTLGARTSTPHSTVTYSSLRLLLLWSLQNETELWSCSATLESPCENPLAAEGRPANIPVALALVGPDLFFEPWHYSSVIFLFLYVLPSVYLPSPLPCYSVIIDNIGNKTQNGLAAACCSLLQRNLPESVILGTIWCCWT